MPPFFINSIYIIYIFFLTFLSQGQLVTGTSKAWLGGFGEIGKPYSYTHPSTQQCTHTHTKAQITDFPTTMTPSAHSHSASDISSGTLSADRIPGLAASKITSGTFSRDRIPIIAVDKGGTGTSIDITNAPNHAIIRRLKTDQYDQLYYTATANGAFYATAANGQATFGTLPIAQGGTGATTAAAARTALGAAAASHSHSGYATTAYVDSKVASVTETVYGGSFNTNNGHTFVTFSSTYAKLKIVFYQYEHSMPSAYTSLVDGTTRIIEKGGSINSIGFDTNYGYSYMTINFDGTKLTASSSGGGYSITYSLGIIAYTS